MIRCPGSCTIVLAAITTLVVFVLLYGPMFVPIVSSFFAVSAATSTGRQPTLAAYVALAQNDGILEALRHHADRRRLRRSSSRSSSGPLLAFYYHGRSRGREILQFIIFLPFLMPPIITGLSLLIFFREIDFERSLRDGDHRPYGLRAGAGLPHRS